VQVQAERDSNNGVREQLAPPVMPAELITMRTGAFIKNVLDPYRSHISQFWSLGEIDLIEIEHKELLVAYNSEAGFKDKIDSQDYETMFNDGWDAFKGRFLHLRQFVAGLGTVFANTASVESDFSVLKWEKDSYRKSMTSLTLEGVMQSKQRELLSSLAN